MCVYDRITYICFVCCGPLSSLGANPASPLTFNVYRTQPTTGMRTSATLTTSQ